jgi:hypothetical protein
MARAMRQKTRQKTEKAIRPSNELAGISNSSLAGNTFFLVPIAISNCVVPLTKRVWAMTVHIPALKVRESLKVLRLSVKFPPITEVCETKPGVIERMGVQEPMLERQLCRFECLISL